MEKKTSIILCVCALLAALVLAGVYFGAEGAVDPPSALPSVEPAESPEPLSAPSIYRMTIEETQEVAEVEYAVADGGVAVTKIGREYNKVIEIPEWIGGMPVTAIREGALDGVEQVMIVRIPATVREIPDKIFDRLNPIFDVIDGTPAIEYLKTHPFEFRLGGAGVENMEWKGIESEGYVYADREWGIVKKDQESGSLRIVVPETEGSELDPEFVYGDELYFLDKQMLKKVEMDGGTVTDFWRVPKGFEDANYELYEDYIYAIKVGGTDYGKAPTGEMIRLDPETGEAKRYKYAGNHVDYEFRGDHVYFRQDYTIYRMNLETGEIQILAGEYDWAADIGQERVWIDGTYYPAAELPERDDMPYIDSFVFVGDEMCYTTTELKKDGLYGLCRYEEGGDDVTLAEWRAEEGAWSLDYRTTMGNWVVYTMDYNVSEEKEGIHYHGREPYEKRELYRTNALTGETELLDTLGGGNGDVLIGNSEVTYYVTDPDTGERAMIEI